jgi:hypothetical protein
MRLVAALGGNAMHGMLSAVAGRTIRPDIDGVTFRDGGGV